VAKNGSSTVVLTKSPTEAVLRHFQKASTTTD
jgi:hypothetical protein